MDEEQLINSSDQQLESERRKIEFQNYLKSPDYKEKIIQRVKINDACFRNQHSRLYTYSVCEKDCIFFIENFLWTFDPRPEHAPHYLPFILFDYQKNIVKWMIDCIDGGVDGLGEKSRDMGFTWLTLSVLLWYWRFREGFNGLMGSYKEALVDNRTKDSLFGMIDFQLERMPDWLMPEGFKTKDHRQKLKLMNPENNNLLTGDTMNPNFGRGSRKTVTVLDEGASWEYFRDAWDSCGDTTSCRMTFSTPKGQNAFWMLRESGINVHTCHWRLHPIKDETWYEFEKSRRTDEEIAQELDISYNKSQVGRVYTEWDNVKFGNYKYDHNQPLFVSWDYGNTDDTAIIWAQPQYDLDGKMGIIDCYWNNGKVIDFYIPFVTGIVPSDSYNYSNRDLDVINEHKNWKIGTHFGDPSGRFKSAVSNKTVFDILADYGIRVNYQKNWNDWETRKTAAKLLLRDNLVSHDNKRTRYLAMCMANARYPEARGGGMSMIKSSKPKHDYTSHFRSSMEYLALGLDKSYKQSHGRRVIDMFPKKEGLAMPGAGRRRVIGY